MDRQEQDQQTAARYQRWDLPLLLKIILLLLLLAALGSLLGSTSLRESVTDGFLGWLVLIILIVLVLLLLWLMRVQRDVTCQLTDPTGCVAEEVDPVAGQLFIRVRGTASGPGFGSYTIELWDGGSQVSANVSYPGGGASGGMPIVNGELGQIDTTSAMDSGYTVRLIVHRKYGGSPKSCSRNFDLKKIIVYISRMAGLQAAGLDTTVTPPTANANPFDEAAELRSGTEVRAVGGKAVRVEGSAYIYDCERISSYEIRYANTSPGPDPSQPAIGTAIPATWPATQRAVVFEWNNPAQYQPWTRVGMAPRDLMNSWVTFTVGTSTFWKLKWGSWDSTSAGSGRFSLLLTAEDTSGSTFHDVQHAWIDNRQILGEIVKFQAEEPPGTWVDLDKCTDLLISKGTIRIMGLAWDPLIDNAFWIGPGPPDRPNDNFDYYQVSFAKQFEGYLPLTGNVPTRVPALPSVVPPTLAVPTSADADELALWDLTTLDAGPAPTPYASPPQGMLYRGESCTYNVRLYVTDDSVIPGPGTHYRWDTEPVKIINDL